MDQVSDLFCFVVLSVALHSSNCVMPKIIFSYYYGKFFSFAVFAELNRGIG